MATCSNATMSISKEGSPSVVIAVDTREAVSVSLCSPLAQVSSSIIASLFASLFEGEVLGRTVKSMPIIRSPLSLRNFFFLAASCSCHSIALFFGLSLAHSAL